MKRKTAIEMKEMNIKELREYVKSIDDKNAVLHNIDVWTRKRCVIFATTGKVR